jgi:hypothetical protein
MKLTKGKISKLYNKKKQSVKKYKQNRKKNSNARTFRKHRKINLANKTLKMIGGDDDEGGIVAGEVSVITNQNPNTDPTTGSDLTTDSEPNPTKGSDNIGATEQNIVPKKVSIISSTDPDPTTVSDPDPTTVSEPKPTTVTTTDSELNPNTVTTSDPTKETTKETTTDSDPTTGSELNPNTVSEPNPNTDSEPNPNTDSDKNIGATSDLTKDTTTDQNGEIIEQVKNAITTLTEVITKLETKKAEKDTFPQNIEDFDKLNTAKLQPEI